MFCRRRYCRNFQTGDITATEMKNKIIQGAILLDVRSNQEFNEGHLQGAINIPDFELLNRIEREIPKKNQLIVIYCEYGGRSREVYIKMRKLGYTNIYNLHGGIGNL